MLKVIIADDEDKICQLIYKLIDWDSLDMKVEAIAHNGIEALELVKLNNPDIIITDIRMPGYDGLEFISRTREINPDIQFVIISGYQQFEYAHKAIKYGVIDYLLKPIKKNELLTTLTKIKNQYLERVDLLTKEEQSELSIKNNIYKLRTGLFNSVLFYNKSKNITINFINNDYGYRFKEGLFQIIIVKLDGVGRSYSTTVTFLEEKLLKVIHDNLKEYCYDMENYFENNIIYSFINYNFDKKKNIRHQCKRLMDELLLQREIFENLEVTIGLGTVENEISMIGNSYKSAVWAYQQRLVLGTNKVIEGKIITSNNFVDSELFHDFNKDMKAALERLDKEAVTLAIHYIREGLRNRPETSGHELLQMTKEICNLFLFTMRYNKFPIDDGGNFLENFSMNANDIGSVYKLYQYLTDVIVNSMNKIIEDKRQSDTKPIRDAKQFIQANYTRQITLDEVSGKVGFNTTYFSSLFKKETGYTFLEYLSEVRIDKAKELLKDTNYSVSVICEHVGYSDIKHFTKTFVKHTNLKPNEYRKLYS